MTRKQKSLDTVTYLNSLIEYKAALAEEKELENKFAQTLIDMERLFTEYRQTVYSLHNSFSKLELKAKELDLKTRPPYPPKLSSSDISLDLYNLLNKINDTGYIARLLCFPHSNDNLQDAWIRQG